MGRELSENTPYTVNKSTWGPGPWQDEPDRAEWTHAGLACLAVRHPRHGGWCGYVGVPPDHPLHGEDWRGPRAEEIADLRFHWGINYSAPCRGEICHTPAPGMPDNVWWFGGDFMHAFELAPGAEAHWRELKIERGITERPLELAPEMREVYRDLAYVRAEVDALADQLAAMA